VQVVVPNQLAAAVLLAQSDAVGHESRWFAIAMRGVLDVRFVPAPAPLGRVSIAIARHHRHDGDPVHACLRDRLREIADEVRSAPARAA